MSTAVFQQVVHTRRVAISVSDGLARALRLRGEFPPLVGEVTCAIVKQTAPVTRDFKPPLTLTSFRNASGFVIVDGTYRGSDTSRSLPLAEGTYTAILGGPYYQDAEFSFEWPPPEGTTRMPLVGLLHLELLPAPTYPVPDVTTTRFQLGPTILRGTLFTPGGSPVEGATVEILNPPPFLQPPELPPLTLAEWPFMKAATNAQGDWVLVLPGRRYLDAAPETPPNAAVITKQFPLRITMPGQGGAVIDLQRNLELGRENSLKNTALRGQVLRGAGRPVAGALITTSVSAATTVSRANGVWFLYFELDQFAPPTVPADAMVPVTVTVTTPDGASASDSSVQAKHETTMVVPTFHFS